MAREEVAHTDPGEDTVPLQAQIQHPGTHHHQAEAAVDHHPSSHLAAQVEVDQNTHTSQAAPREAVRTAPRMVQAHRRRSTDLETVKSGHGIDVDVGADADVHAVALEIVKGAYNHPPCQR